jgi:hypothetical protein
LATLGHKNALTPKIGPLGRPYRQKYRFYILQDRFTGLANQFRLIVMETTKHGVKRMKIEQQKAQIKTAGIQVDTILTDENNTAKLSIYAKPCSPFCFELIWWDWNGDYYVLKLNDSLPIESYNVNPESFHHLSKLVNHITKHGHKFVA